MASRDAVIVPIALGAISNATRPAFKVPSTNDGGGVTIVEADGVMGGSANSQFYLVKMDPNGTAIEGTLTSATGTTAAWATNVPVAFTVNAGAYVEAGHWVGVKENNVGAGNAITVVTITYIQGK